MSQQDRNPAFEPPSEQEQPTSRRLMLQSAAAIIATQMGGEALAATTAVQPASSGKAEPNGNGAAGDFSFLTGNWKIANRRRKSPGVDEWDVFPGEATVWSILNGVCSIEELRIPARNFSGMGLRLLDLEKKVWIDHWVNAKSGVIGPPGTIGQFANGVGMFRSEWVNDKGETIQVRSAWDRITPTSCRWYQQVSKDGKVWEDEWTMDWTRVTPAV
jgi:hypothetical protein